MQFVNDDMDDELYRRAAEEYPLKTEGADWNKLRDKLNAANGNSSGKKTWRGIFLILALVPLVLICTTYINSDRATVGAGKLDQATTNTHQSEGNNNSSPNTKNFNNSISLEKNSVREDLNIEVNKTQRQNSFTKNSTKPVDRVYQYSESKDYHVNKENAVTSFSKNQNKNLQTRNTNEKFKDVPDDKTAAVNEEQSKQQETAIADNKKPVDDYAKSENNMITTAETNDLLTKKDSATTPTIVANAQKKKQQNKQPRFYFGFQAGPDFSMVKSTNTNRAGYSVGLVAGFNLSNKFALETGFLWDQKKYNARGQDFKTDKLNWPHVTILDLSGYCNMFEIPVNVRYNFINAEKATWFANAGVSSYFMKKENYDYHYQSYGVYNYGNKEYKNTTNNWFSVAHLSVGMQKKLGTIGDLRIEPYIKLPLQGVGIGSMPLRSTGIYLGITRPIR